MACSPGSVGSSDLFEAAKDEAEVSVPYSSCSKV